MTSSPAGSMSPQPTAMIPVAITKAK